MAGNPKITTEVIGPDEARKITTADLKMRG